MDEAIQKVADSASWKLRTLLRTSRFYNKIDLVNLYKSKVLSYIEGKTAAVYHATSTLLSRLDRIQTNFITQVGITEIEAMRDYRLAPLTSRRDMAMLAVIHRAVLGLGPDHFRDYFKPDLELRNPGGREQMRRHNLQLQTFRRGKYLQIVGNSMFGLVDVYNLLPARVVAADTVKEFQKRLQSDLIHAAEGVERCWQDWYSPRIMMFNHPLRMGMVSIGQNEHMGEEPERKGFASSIHQWLQFGQ